MKKEVLYINFSKATYIDMLSFYRQQRHTFLYKAELTSFFYISYAINSNLRFDVDYKSIRIISKNINRAFFFIFILSFIKKRDVDAVIVHGTNYFLKASLIKLFCGTGVILQHHAEKTYLSKKALLMPFCKRFIDLYFFNGKEIAQPFIEKKYISENKVVGITEGATSFQLKSKIRTIGSKQICFIGRLNRNKNLITVLEAIVKLKARRKDFQLSVYYHVNDDENELKIFCERNNLNELVIFKGEVPHTEVEKILNETDIYISASLYEGSGYALIEALACGCYPVASNIPSFNFLLRDLEHKEQFNPEDSEELATVLNKILNLDLKENIRKEIRHYFEATCSPQAIAKQINQAVQAIL